MKLRILSDLHLEFGPLEIQPADCDAVVLAGDIHPGIHGVQWAVETFRDQPVLFVAGNHEYYGRKIPKLHRQIEEIAAKESLCFLNNTEVVLNGTRFLGGTLWSDFSLFGMDQRLFAIHEASELMTDYRRIRMGKEHHYRKLRPYHVISMHERTVHFLKKQLARSFDGPTVVVTHHLPSPKSLKAGDLDHLYRAAYCTDLEWLIEAYQPDLWVHGHRHLSSDYTLGKTRVICNPRGYYGDKPVKTFDPDFVVEV